MAKPTMKKDYDENTGISTIAMLDGQTIVTDVRKLGAKDTDGGVVIPFGSVAMQALLHGVNQKIGDSAAGQKTDEDRYEAMLTTHEQICSGEWNKKREGGEGTRPSLVVEAVIRAKESAGLPVDRDAILAKYSGKDGEEARKTALANPQVKAAYEALRAEAATERAKKAAAAAGEPGDLSAI